MARHVHSRLLLAGASVRVFDVVCTAPAGGCGAVEHARVAQVLVPRRGVFAVHRGRAAAEPAIADAASAVVLGADDEYRVSHPGAHGDRCTTFDPAPALVEEALGGETGGAGRVRAAVQLRAAVLAGALARGQLDALAAEEEALLLVGAVAQDLGRSAPLADRRPAPAALRRAGEVRALLAASPAAPWRLEEVARVVGWSSFHLARQFRAATGESVGRHLERLRLGMALDRVADGEDDLARLAVDCGFAHHSHLTARFRRAFGVTPSAARAAARS